MEGVIIALTQRIKASLAALAFNALVTRESTTDLERLQNPGGLSRSSFMPFVELFLDAFRPTHHHRQSRPLG